MLAVVRITGKANLERGTKDTLKMLRLDAPHHCVLLPDTPDYKGMVEKVKDYVTYGEVDKQTLVELLRKRLNSHDNKKIADLKTVTGHNSHEELAEVLLQGRARLSNFKNVQPVFRLTSPSKGFKSVKSNYPEGDLGYRGNAINSLLGKMI